MVFVALAPGAVHLDLGNSKSADKATSGRYDLIKGGLKLFSDAPLVGQGSGSFAREYRRAEHVSPERAASASHTIPVTVAAEQGVIGLVVYLALLAAALARLFRGARRRARARRRGGGLRGARGAYDDVRGLPGGPADVDAAGRGHGDGAVGRRARAGAGMRRAEARQSSPRWRSLALVAALLVPTYPNYDTYFHLVWGRELMHGMKPDFEAYAAPTEHPLFLALCALVGLVGTDGERLIVLVCVLSPRGARVGHASASATRASACGRRWPAPLFVGSSFAFLLYAARAYVDVPFLALVLWAAALEARAPRRGLPVMATLAVAGLLRPEAWVLAGAYWLWCGWRRLDLLALAAAAPLVWCLVDLWVTGDPLFSLHATNDLADELNRNRGLSSVPGSFASFVTDTARPPVALAAAAGALLLWRLRTGPRAARADRAVRRRRGHLPGHRAGRALGAAALPHDPGGGRLPGRRLRRARLHDAARRAACAGCGRARRSPPPRSGSSSWRSRRPSSARCAASCASSGARTTTSWPSCTRPRSSATCAAAR